MKTTPTLSAVLAFGAVLVILCASPSASAEERTSYARTIVIGANETADDVTCFLCSVVVRGAVQGDVVTIGGNIEIEGTVTRDAVAAGGDICIGPLATLKGDATAIGGFVNRDTHAGSNPDDESLPWFSVPGQISVHWRGALGLAGFHALIAILFGAILRARRLRNIGGTLIARPLVTFLIGIVILILTRALFFATNYFGRWEGLAVWTLAGLVSVLMGVGWVGIAHRIGEIFMPEIVAGALAIGVAAITILELIPFLGLLVFLLLLLLGPGTAILSRSGSRDRGDAPPVSGTEAVSLPQR